MKTVVIFYSYTGKTRKLANETAKKENADIIELKERKMPSKPVAYVCGSLAARGNKMAKLEKFNCDFSKYEKIILLMPIWAGCPAPPMNNIISMLPAGKNVELILTSGSGSSKGSAEKTKALIAAKGSTVTKYVDIKL